MASFFVLKEVHNFFRNAKCFSAFLKSDLDIALCCVIHGQHFIVCGMPLDSLVKKNVC